MNAEIITIGDELLIGQVINTNQAYIAEQLNLVGVSVRRMTTLGDDEAEILAGFEEAWRRADVVVVTGGLGPTHDDITKKVVCRFFGTHLVPNVSVRAHIETLYRARNMAWSQSAEEQALVPQSAEVLSNPVGSAPGLFFRQERKCFFVMPGVPYEMKAIVDGSIIPFLKRHGVDTVIRHLTLRTSGIAESVLAKHIGPVEKFLGAATLAFLPSPTGVRLRITVRGTENTSVEADVSRIETYLRSRIGKYVYGTGADELEEVLGQLLAGKKLTIAVAESITGGLVTDRLTNVSGSSTYFERGVIAYSNQSKTQLLGVPPGIIEAHGAVSSEVAKAMASGVRSISGADIGLATTGIAGPTGGTDLKPVGLVWVGYADSRGEIAIHHQFGGQRRIIKERASQAALEMVRRRLLNLP